MEENIKSEKQLSDLVKNEQTPALFIPDTSKIKSKLKLKSPVLIIIIFLVLIIGIVLGYFQWSTGEGMICGGPTHSQCFIGYACEDTNSFTVEHYGKCVHFGHSNQNISVLPSRSQKAVLNSNSNVANWKTYTNTKFGFSLKYPPDWGSDKCPAGFNTDEICASEKIGTGPEPIMYYIYMGKFDNPQNATFKDTVTKDMPKSLQDSFKFTTDIIANLTVYKTASLLSRSGAQNVFFRDKSGNFVSISFTPYDTQGSFPQQDKFYNIYNQILSTFKFTK